MKFKRILTLLCVGILTVALLSGCAIFGDEAPSEATETENLQSVQ